MLHCNLHNVSKLKISGLFDVSIINSIKEECIVEVMEEHKKYIRHRVVNDTLELELKRNSGFLSFKPNTSLKVNISLKQLQSLELNGEPSVSFDGFNGDQLAIKCKGRFDLNGGNSSYTSLYLEKTGAGRVDLKNTSVTNAEVMSMGIGDLMLNINGGHLSGKIMGVGKTILSGIISENSLINMGISSVRYKVKT